MKKTIRHLLTMAILLVGVFVVSASAQDETNKRVKAMLVKPIVITADLKTPDSEATVSPTNSAGVSAGLSNMRLIGRNSFSKRETGETGVAIDWHSISLNSGTDSISEPLSKPLASMFSTGGSKVETGELITVSGDWDELLKNLTALKKKQEEKVTKVESVDEEKNQKSGIEPVGATSSTPPTSNSPYSTMNTDVQKTTYEDCPPFFNEGAGVVEEQKQKIVTGQSGTTYENGLCTSTGVFYPIKTKDGECGFQWDLEAKVATKTVQRYYELNAEPVEVGECWASNSTYPITEFNDVCDVRIDVANMLAFPQSRLGFAYTDSGLREYYNDCSPQGTIEWPLFDSNCTDDEGAQRYEHDLTNHFSYPLERRYYVDPEDGSQVFINECSRSTSISYEHKYETDTCGWVLDDEKLQGQQFSYTYIETPEGNIPIASCAARTAPVPYAYVGLTDTVTLFQNIDTGSMADGFEEVVQYFTPPPGLTKLKVSLVGGGQQGRGASGGRAKAGGASSLGLKDRVIEIASDEVVPFYVGRNGRFQQIDRYTAYGHEGSGSWFGDDNSSFARLQTGYANYRPGGPEAPSNTGAGGTYPQDGGNGGNGWEWSNSPDASPGYNLWNDATPGGTGGRGWGAGGGGSGVTVVCSTNFNHNTTCNTTYGRPGSGAPGMVEISYRSMKYLRPDGTYHNLPYNGD